GRLIDQWLTIPLPTASRPGRIPPPRSAGRAPGWGGEGVTSSGSATVTHLCPTCRATGPVTDDTVGPLWIENGMTRASSASAMGGCPDSAIFVGPVHRNTAT